MRRPLFRTKFVPVLAALGLSACFLAAADTKAVKVQSAEASSTFGEFAAAKAIDGIISDQSRWVSQKSTEPAW